MNEILKQFLKEIGRVVILAVIPVLLAYLEIISPEIAALITVALKGADRASYKAGGKIKLPF